MRVTATREDQRGLLDAASTIRVGLTQFMDDNAHRTSSRGGLAQAFCKLDAASHSIRGERCASGSSPVSLPLVLTFVIVVVLLLLLVRSSLSLIPPPPPPPPPRRPPPPPPI
eukprot:8073944-Pyramimonas_sp.AAC.1